MAVGATDLLVAVDGSADSGHALEWAAREAALRQCGLVVLSAVQPPYSGWAGGGSTFGPQLEAAGLRTSQVLEEAAARVRELEPRVEVTTQQVLDGAAHAILEAAPGVAQVVVGAHGHGRLERLLAGSVSMHVVAHCEQPVVVVRPAASPDGPVLVGLDGSAASSEALAYAVEAAVLHGRPLLAVHAWEDYASDGSGAVELSPDVLDERSAEATASVEAELAPWRQRQPQLQAAALAERGHPFEVLRRHSAAASLLVLGSHGHSALGRLVAGSTAMAALYRAECTIAVVRPRSADPVGLLGPTDLDAV
ncbi:nucleotide-binding universal stress UspA family protein [Motilibacter peucedani]|uniref:Nucleotide-binding universal stress UspA family protein n=1 Tax=Motilibacter peucedani TaxID=598650 RepID=A0A420XQI0_9ACTN|nr:universal stress protein [Motilibacter peucedani]RKS75497.1 nucleotide-binding universal stress UspA family protein [Motilibacter peucedani]